MNEVQKTGVYAGVAGLLLLLAMTTRAWGPASFDAAPEDEGTPFFPTFTDFTQATSLEVWDFDAAQGAGIPFKVELKDGVWTIPSKNGYPADGKDRLGKTAAAVMGLTRESLRSTREEDHVSMGVVDPTAESGGLEGRGRRVTLRDGGGKLLADVILGKPVEGAEGLRYVRLPTEKRVYAAKAAGVDPSVKFEDWIERDLLLLDVAAITTLTVDKYSVDEQLLRAQGVIKIHPGEKLVLGKQDADWRLSDQKPEEKLDQAKVSDLTSALDAMEIVDVSPFADELLESAGFFPTRDQGVFSNEGELIVDTNDGIRTMIRFGEALPGDQDDGALRRYVVITAHVNEKALPKGDDGKVTPEARKKADERAKELGERFGKWFYVISGKSYDALRPARASLLDTSSDEDEHGMDDGHDHGGEDEGMFPPVEPMDPITPPEPQGPPAPPATTTEAAPPATTSETAPPPAPATEAPPPAPATEAPPPAPATEAPPPAPATEAAPPAPATEAPAGE